MFELRIALLRRRLVALAIAASVPSACNEPVDTNISTLPTGAAPVDPPHGGVLPGDAGADAPTGSPSPSPSSVPPPADGGAVPSDASASAPNDAAAPHNDAGAAPADAGKPPPEPKPECTTDADCNDGVRCTVDSCIAQKCVRAHHSDASWSTPLVPSAEVVLGGGVGVIQTIYDGSDFLVVWRDGSGGTFARRVSPSGSVVDPAEWGIPGEVVGMAFDGTKYMALRNETDANTGSIVPHVGFVQRSGNVGSFWAVDLYCRNSGTYCYGSQVVYGGGSFLVLYAGAGWREISYALYGLGGNVIQRVALASGLAGSPAQGPSATFDGYQFAVAWDDYRDLSNAASIYGAHIAPAGGNAAYAGHVPIFQNPGNDLYAAARPTLTAGTASYLVTFNGFLDDQVRRLSTSFGADPQKVSGMGAQFDLQTRTSTFDGKNYIVGARTCGNTFACNASAAVYASRVTESGAKIDLSPVLLAPTGSTYPQFASSRTGKNVVAYERGGAIIARVFETCP